VQEHAQRVDAQAPRRERQLSLDLRPVHVDAVPPSAFDALVGVYSTPTQASVSMKARAHASASASAAKRMPVTFFVVVTVPN
jgi:hypothetical protein